MRRIPIERPASAILWDGDQVVDPVGGSFWDYPFDTALRSPSGRFTVLYAERGIKGEVLDNGRPIRELNRSYAHAGSFDFPIAVGALPDGREVVAYCPEQYNVLHIEDLATGERLTSRAPAEPKDQFHSRLEFGPSGRFLLVAGWVWQPFGIASVWDVPAAIADPALLDSWGTVEFGGEFDEEITAACWLDDDRILVASTDPWAMGLGRAAAATGATAKPGEIGVWSVASGSWLKRATVDRPLGNLIGLGDRALALYAHPALIDAETGAVIEEWPDIDTGMRSGSYGVTHIPNPKVALHPDRTRVAIAQPDHIAVLDLR